MLSMGNTPLPKPPLSRSSPGGSTSSVVVDTPATKLRFLGRSSSFEAEYAATAVEEHQHLPLSPSSMTTSPHQRVQYLASFADMSLLQRTPTKQKAE